MAQINIRRNVFRVTLSLAVMTFLSFSATANTQNYLQGKQHLQPIKYYDILHYRLDLLIQPEKKTISGTVQIRFVPTCDTLTTLTLNADSMVIKSVGLNRNQKITWFKQPENLLVALGTAFNQRDTLTLIIDYRVTEPKKGLFFNLPDGHEYIEVYSQGEMEDNHYWFPCWDFPNDRATSEIIATIPSPFIVIANGKLLTEKTNPDSTRTFHWQMNQEHVSYLISLVAGDYVCLHDQYKNISLEYVVHAGDSVAARVTFSKTPTMIPFYEQIIGMDFPYNRYSQAMVHDYFYGGMENITATTLNYSSLKDRRQLIDSNSEELISHELVHQWWGDLITCQSWSHCWLNEGFATYFEALWTEHADGSAAFQLKMNRNAQAYFMEDEMRHRRALVWDHYNSPLDIFDAHDYQKGAWVLHMLRHELGDAKFWQAIRFYAKKFAGRCVTTADFQQAIEEATGIDMNIFFQQWVYRAGYPDFKVTKQYDAQSKQLLVEVYQQQKPDSLLGIFDLSAEIEITTPQKQTVHKVQINSDSCRFSFPCDGEPLMVRFDPQNWLLKKIEFKKSTPEWLYQLSHAAEAGGRLDACQELHLLIDQTEVCAALVQQFKQEVVAAIRREIVQTLEDAPPAYLAQILSFALHDPNSRVRAEAVDALVIADSLTTGSFDTLLAIYHSDSSYSVQKAVLRASIKIDSTQAIALLQQALQTESFQDNLRLGALIALRDIHSPDLIGSILPFTEKPYINSTRYQTFLVLSHIGEKDDLVYSKLLAHLEDSDSRIRRLCTTTLVKINKPEALPQLQSAYDKEPIDRIKNVMAAAIKTLEKTKEELQKR